MRFQCVVYLNLDYPISTKLSRHALNISITKISKIFPVKRLRIHIFPRPILSPRLSPLKIKTMRTKRNAVRERERE